MSYIIRKCFRFSSFSSTSSTNCLGTNWRLGGTLLGTHRLPIFPPSPPSHPQPHLHAHLPNGAHPNPPDTNGTVTSLALDGDYVVIGLANSNVKVYSARTGVLVRTLMGHESGVWGVCLVSRGGWMDVEEGRRKGKGKCRRKEMSVEEGEQNFELSETIGAEMRHALGLDEDNDEVLDEEPEDNQSKSDGESDNELYEGHTTTSDTLPEKNYKPGRPSYMSLSSIGWGQPNSIIVSGGCDKVLKVWDAKSGFALPFL